MTKPAALTRSQLYRNLYEASDLTQAEIATLMGKSLSTIGRWSRPERSDGVEAPLYAIGFLWAWQELSPEKRAKMRARLAELDRNAGAVVTQSLSDG